MDFNKDSFKIVYNREANMLYVTKGSLEHTDYIEPKMSFCASIWKRSS